MSIWDAPYTSAQLREHFSGKFEGIGPKDFKAVGTRYRLKDKEKDGALSTFFYSFGLDWSELSKRKGDLLRFLSLLRDVFLPLAIECAEAPDAWAAQMDGHDVIGRHFDLNDRVTRVAVREIEKIAQAVSDAEIEYIRAVVLRSEPELRFYNYYPRWLNNLISRRDYFKELDAKGKFY